MWSMPLVGNPYSKECLSIKMKRGQCSSWNMSAVVATTFGSYNTEGWKLLMIAMLLNMDKRSCLVGDYTKRMLEGR